MIGKTLLHYKIIRKLGQGGMGVVYKARDTKLDRDVAVKFLPPHIAADPEERQRFETEAKAAAALNHPNITQVYAIEEVNDELFIVMEYISGRELKELSIDDHQSVVDYAVQIASGLQAAHEKGIIHRDIKSSNIMVTDEGKVKIMDFGLAKIGAGTHITKDYSTLGTISYMSPEQARGEKIDHRTDIWSLGVLMYEMLTGTLPFRGDYEQAVIYSVINEKHHALNDSNPDIPARFEKLIDKLLEKAPENRYPTVKAFLADLEEIGSSATHLPGFASLFSVKKSNRPAFAALTVFLALAAFFYWPVSTETKMSTVSVTILPFEYRGDKDWNWLSLAATDMLHTNLSKYTSLRLTGAQQLKKINKKLGLSQQILQKEQARQMARMARSSSFITGTIEKRNDSIRIRANIFETGNGKLIAEISSFRDNTGNLSKLAENISAQIFSKLDTGLQPAAATEYVEKYVPKSLDAYRFYLEGKDAVLDQRHEEGIEKLEMAIRLDEKYVEPYYWLAHEYSLSGDLSRAGEILKKGKSYISQLSKAERLRYLSNEAGIENRWQDYATYLEELLKINPDDPVDHARYGWTQYKKFRRMDAGIRELETAIKLDSSYGWAYNTLGYAWLEKGNAKKALAMIDRYIALNPTDVDPLDSKAELFFLTGSYKKAIRLCERILATQPNYYSSYLTMFGSLVATGKYSRALNTFNRFIKVSEGSNYQAAGYSALAKLRFRQNQYEEALNLVSKALAIDSTDLETQWLNGRILLKLNRTGRLEKSIPRFEMELYRQGGLDQRWFLYHLKGEIARADKNFSEAIDWFKKAINLWPRNRSFYLARLAAAYREADRNPEALKYYLEAVRFNPNNAPATLGLAQTYEKLKRNKDARNAYRKVLQIWNTADGQIQGLEFAGKKLRDFQ